MCSLRLCCFQSYLFAGELPFYHPTVLGGSARVAAMFTAQVRALGSKGDAVRPLLLPARSLLLLPKAIRCSLFCASAIMGHKVIVAVTHMLMWLLLH